MVAEAAEALIREAEGARKPLAQPNRSQSQLKPTYPEWPTSTPGPQATSPLPGMKPVPTRTDQMVYVCYDQERGRPCTDVPERRPSTPVRQHPLADQVKGGMQVYDAQGARIGKIVVRYPHYLLVERGLIFRQSYYVPLSLVQGVEGKRVRLAVSEATLASRGHANVPHDLYHLPRPPGARVYPDISGIGMFPPTPAETGFYHYGPLGPGINTDASGSYAPYEIDPYGRPVDRPVKLYRTGELVELRSL